MLTFTEKQAIIESYPELTKKQVSLGRLNYQFEDSATDKKNVVYHLHPNGNGYVYAEKLKGYETNETGMVNIRDFSEDELHKVLQQSIASLTENIVTPEEFEEQWINRDQQTLMVVHEDDMWNIYAGVNLDGTFPSYNEAKQYLDEEGFRRLE